MKEGDVVRVDWKFREVVWKQRKAAAGQADFRIWPPPGRRVSPLLLQPGLHLWRDGQHEQEPGATAPGLQVQGQYDCWGNLPRSFTRRFFSQLRGQRQIRQSSKRNATVIASSIFAGWLAPLRSLAAGWSGLSFSGAVLSGLRLGLARRRCTPRLLRSPPRRPEHLCRPQAFCRFPQPLQVIEAAPVVPEDCDYKIH